MLYEATAIQFIRMLENLDAILDKGAEHADSKKFDVTVLLNSRLAPDQFNLIKQIQIACDTAKLGVARLAGKEKDAPVHEDNETTLAELKDRIANVIKYLKSFKPSDLEGAEQRNITMPRWEGKYLTGLEFATQYAIPNLFFHVTTAYSILRHNGVNLGKRDYLGTLPFKR